MFIYNTYFEPLSIFITQNNGTMADAQDVFQDVVVSFIHIVKKQKYRQESSVKTFLFSINRNIWYNELKRKGRQELRETRYELTNEQEDKNIGTILEQQESGHQLLKIMDTLGAICKKILHLFYYENYTIRDLLPVLGYENEQVVRNKKYKCLKKLEEMIEENKDFYQQLKKLLNG